MVLLTDFYLRNTFVYSLNVLNFKGMSFVNRSLSIKSRLTVVSCKAKKKQHAHVSSGPRDHYSELFTRMAALKF